MNKNKRNYVTNFIKFIKKHYKITILLLVLVIAIIIPKKESNIFEKSGYNKIQRMSEMATIEVIYHNVASYEKDSDGLLNLTKYGYKKYWLEYEGTIKFGIDAKKIKINKPNKKGIVKVYIPEAKVIGEPNVNKEKMKEPIIDKGFLTSITPQEKSNAFIDAQKNMKENAEKDTELLFLARENAKAIIKNYIIKTAKKIGKEYQVEFID